MNHMDVGVREDRRRITRLVIAAQAHDEVLGCGGVLAKYREGSAVVLLTKPDDDISAEFDLAQRALGYEQSFECRLPVGTVGHDMRSLVHTLGDLLNATRPVEIYVPYPGADRDRMAAFEAGLRLARSTVREGQWVPPTVLMYGLWDAGMPRYSTDVNWSIRESLGDTDLDRKIAGALAYHSLTILAADVPHAIRTFAKATRSYDESGWGERFAVVRSAWQTVSEPVSTHSPAVVRAVA